MTQVELNRIDERYSKILKENGICAEIEVVHGTPKKDEIVNSEGKHIIRLNVDKIAASHYGDYEDFLAYNVRKLVLPNMNLESERLVIRRLRMEDAEDLFESLNDREACYMDGGFEPYPEMNEAYMELMQDFSKDETHFVLVRKDTGRAIGGIHLMPCSNRMVECIELGWYVNPSCQRKGYAFEGISRLLDYLMNDLHLDMVVAAAIEDNVPSLNLMKKLGFTYEGNIHKAFWYPPKGKVDLMSFYKER